MKRVMSSVLVLVLLLACISLAGCGSRPAKSKPSSSRTATLSIVEASKAMKDFAIAQGTDNQDRQIDADVKKEDKLVAAGSTTDRISSYNLKFTTSGNQISGYLVEGKFQVKSDIENLKDSFDFVEYRNSSTTQEYETFVNGKRASAPDPANDKNLLFANAYLSGMISNIDKQYIKTASKNEKEGGALTEYTVAFDVDGLTKNKDLYEAIVKEQIRNEVVRYDAKRITYTFTLDKDGTPKSYDFHIILDAIDKTNDTAHIDTEVAVTFNSFADVIIKAPAGSSDAQSGGSDTSSGSSSSTSGIGIDSLAKIVQGSLAAGIQDGDAAGDCSDVAVKAEGTNTLVCTYTLKAGAKAPSKDMANNEAQWYVFTAVSGFVKNPVAKYVYLNSNGSKAAEYTFAATP